MQKQRNQKICHNGTNECTNGNDVYLTPITKCMICMRVLYSWCIKCNWMCIQDKEGFRMRRETPQKEEGWRRLADWLTRIKNSQIYCLVTFQGVSEPPQSEHGVAARHGPRGVHNLRGGEGVSQPSRKPDTYMSQILSANIWKKVASSINTINNMHYLNCQAHFFFSSI